MSNVYPSSSSLINHFEAQTLGQLGIQASQLIFSSSHQPTSLPKTGKDALLAKIPIFGDGKPTCSMDIDLSCLVYDKAHKLIDKVWYGKLRSQNDAIRHQGDSFKGVHRAYHSNSIDESIVVRLSHLPNEVNRLIFAVQSYHRQALAKADFGSIRLGTNEGHLIHDMAFDTLPPDCTVLHAWQMQRMADDWHITALMANIKGGLLNQII